MKLFFALALLSTTLAAPVAVTNNEDASAKPVSSLWHSGSPFAHPIIPGGQERPAHLPAPGRLLAEAETTAPEFAANFEIATSSDDYDGFGARISAARHRLAQLLNSLGRSPSTTAHIVVVENVNTSDSDDDAMHGYGYLSQETMQRAADRAVQRTMALLSQRRVYAAVLLVIAMLNLVTISLALRFFKKTACRRCGHVEDGSRRSLCHGEVDDEFAADEQDVAAASYPVEKAPVAV